MIYYWFYAPKEITALRHRLLKASKLPASEFSERPRVEEKGLCLEFGVDFEVWFGLWAGGKKKHLHVIFQNPLEAKKAVACLRRWSRYCTCCRGDWHKGAEAETEKWCNSNWMFVHSRNTSFNHPEGHDVEPCYAINLNTRRYPEYFMIFLRHTRLLSNINHMSFFIFFILQLDPSLAPQPKRVFFDDTLSIIIIISVGRTHLGGDHRTLWGTWRSPQPDGICKVEL